VNEHLDEPDTYALRRRSGPELYLLGLVIAIIAVANIVFGPVPAKLFFAYFFLGIILTFVPAVGRRYAKLTPNELHIKNWILTRIPYSHIAQIKEPSSRSLSKAISRLVAGKGSNGVDIQITLTRTHWLFVPFPFPMVFPTRSIWLATHNGDSLAERLARRVARLESGA
jgi:hypothetical protein